MTPPRRTGLSAVLGALAVGPVWVPVYRVRMWVATPTAVAVTLDDGAVLTEGTDTGDIAERYRVAAGGAP